MKPDFDSSFDAQTSREDVCALLQEIGLPAVRIEIGTADVSGFNGLLFSLMRDSGVDDPRLWFVESVLPQFTAADRARWEAAVCNRDPVEIHVALQSRNGRSLGFELRTVPSLRQFDRSIVCVFIPQSGAVFERASQAWITEGRRLERCRIRNELHKEIAQQLLGAAFGYRLLAGKIGELSEDLGQQASDLAELLNEAVLALQNLISSGEE